MKKIIILSFAVLAALLFIQRETFACGCPARSKDMTKEVAQDYGRSSKVFSGKVIEAKWVPATEKNTAGKKIKAEVLILRFAVDKWWKGRTARDEVVWRTSSMRYPESNAGRGGSNCEYAFELGKRYLVYANGLPGKLSADVCRGTTRIENAGPDIEELQRLKKAEKKTSSG
jgi:hypothetical protein